MANLDSKTFDSHHYRLKNHKIKFNTSAIANCQNESKLTYLEFVRKSPQRLYEMDNTVSMKIF